jgi:nucleotide-binding universal stress UspA family protein
MTAQPVIAGVDGSPESLHAAVAAAVVARRAGSECRLVTAVPDYGRILASYGMLPGGPPGAVRAAEARDRERITARLQGYVPDQLCDTLELRAGPPPLVLHEAARRLGAGAIVLGSRHHHGLDRLRRSTVTWLARSADIPLLVTTGSSLTISRVLAAVDLSPAAGLVLDAAREWAGLFGASLRLLHVAEPRLSFPGVSDSVLRSADAEEWLETSGIVAKLADARAEKVMRRGDAVTAIERETIEWSADLLVVGTHGANWIDRLLLGSTTELLLKRPPTLMLLVPVTAAPRPAGSGTSAGRDIQPEVVGAP